MRHEYRMLLDKPDKKRVFGGHKHRWEYNIKTDTKEKIYGQIKENGIWISRYNHELYIMNQIY